MGYVIVVLIFIIILLIAALFLAGFAQKKAMAGIFKYMKYKGYELPTSKDLSGIMEFEDIKTNLTSHE